MLLSPQWGQASQLLYKEDMDLHFTEWIQVGLHETDISVGQDGQILAILQYKFYSINH